MNVINLLYGLNKETYTIQSLVDFFFGTVENASEAGNYCWDRMTGMFCFYCIAT
jgi:hypothetical protein